MLDKPTKLWCNINMVKKVTFSVGDLVRYEGGNHNGKVFVGIVTEIDPVPHPLATECYIDGMKQWVATKHLKHIPKGWTVDTSHLGA